MAVVGDDTTKQKVTTTAVTAGEARIVAEDLLPRLRAIDGLADVEMDRMMGNPTVEVTVDREKALRFGLEPETLARVQRNLAVIDEALGEVHRALEQDPNRPELGRMLASTHRKRVDVLRKMVKLSTAL